MCKGSCAHFICAALFFTLFFIYAALFFKLLLYAVLFKDFCKNFIAVMFSIIVQFSFVFQIIAISCSWRFQKFLPLVLKIF